MAQLLTVTEYICGQDCGTGEAFVGVTWLICGTIIACVGLFIFFDD